MTIKIENRMIPGTQMDKQLMGNVTGLAFLDKIFYIQNGIMLAQIRDISGIDGSTLQNWVKRGWTGNAVNKKYTKDQLSRILLINMMRQTTTSFPNPSFTIMSVRSSKRQMKRGMVSARRNSCGSLSTFTQRIMPRCSPVQRSVCTRCS